ncbi:MAG: leucine-rich repeat protein, partial [Eubacteriales bacterium]|nr:leucine-rich repeat protein [Eubacteriales bacterium]
MRVNKTISVFLSLVMLFSITVGISFSTYANESDTGGSCGENVQWEYADGTLTISGTGNMEVYSNTPSLPWYDYINEITKLVIENGVKTIASFRSLGKVQEINIPNSVHEINAYTFIGCYSLEKINLSNNLQFLGTDAFSGCPMLQDFTINNSPNGKTNDILGPFGDVTGYFFVRDGILFSFSDTYYKEDLSKVSIEHIRLEKYPSGREGETYVIPQDTMVVAW